MQVTILGAVATDAGGVVWADSESFVFGETVSTTVSKIKVFPLFGLVSVSNGAVLLGRKGNDLLDDCNGFDDAFDRLPHHLARARTGFESECSDYEISINFEGTFVVMGYSKRFKQNLVASFDSNEKFRRRLTRLLLSPVADVYGELDDNAIRAIAVEQMVKIRQDYPGASGGKLVVARLIEKEISIYCLPAEGFRNRRVHASMTGHAGLGLRPCPASSQESATHREISQNVI